MAHKSSKIFHIDSKAPNRFGITHGPGAVFYTVDQFLLKNRDLLASSLEKLMQDSGADLIKGLFTPSRVKPKSVSSLYLVRL